MRAKQWTAKSGIKTSSTDQAVFDVAFSELVVIAIIALIVIGPEKLPKVARTLGLLLGRMQRYINTVKTDISRELQFEELQKLQQEMRQSTHRIENELGQVRSQAADEARNIEQSIGGAVKEAGKPPTVPDERQ